MSIPDISICASAVRPWLWKDFINSLNNQACNVEVVFVGDKQPEFELPSNIHWLYSPVKPSQCWEAAIRFSTGRYVSISADDAEYDPMSISNMVKFMDSQLDRRVVGSFQTIENGHLITHDHFYKGKQMAPFFVFDRQYYFDLGGADKRFIGGMWENDVIMRVWQDGGRVEVCQDAFVRVEHLKKHNATSKSCEWHFKHGFPLFESLWVDIDKRTDELQPFNMDNILTESQGEKGDW